MTQRMLQTLSDSLRRQASREYIRQRVTGMQREAKRETDAEVRAYVRGILTTHATD